MNGLGPDGPLPAQDPGKAKRGGRCMRGDGKRGQVEGEIGMEREEGQGRVGGLD